MALRLVYITAKDEKEAKAIGKELVEGKLAACVNIIEDMTSIYHWKGKLHEDDEVVLIAKTQEKLVPQLMKRVRALHSYSCPCILTLPVAEGNEEYVNWVEGQTQ